MAVSGSATSAYRVRFNGLTLSTMPTTTQNSMCTPPSVAVGLLAAGDTVTIAGSDNKWHNTLPPKDKHIIVWMGAGEDVAYWTGKAWRSVTTGKILYGVDWWREDE
jgi:hypothetical protein